MLLAELPGVRDFRYIADQRGWSRAASQMSAMSDTRPDLENSARAVRNDRWLIGVGTVIAAVLAIVLWSQAGRDVFAAAMTGLWALCF